MIEMIVNNYLNHNLSAPSFLERTDKKIKRFVLIEKTGGSKRNHLKKATLVFQSYGTSLFKAAELNEELKQVVEQMIELDQISNISLNSDYEFTDTTTKEYRYQAVFDINYY
ncbi:hypothetical protein P7H60_06270 [Vagococcus carniphilus]|uniref:hypothetical protein n=1 Tax=Vagococcus carniphilus TaxID=218144 RepID=UPI0028915FAD|nr:hypothetical protein [Vagococcus carniphilus]MDT2848762.1 hypothetical protein [Vagococcus carniphilus]